MLTVRLGFGTFPCHTLWAEVLRGLRFMGCM